MNPKLKRYLILIVVWLEGILFGAVIILYFFPRLVPAPPHYLNIAYQTATLILEAL